jgi:hypothetical protein
MENQTAFAADIMAATAELMEAIASSNPMSHLGAALGHAHDAAKHSANIIEASIAEKLTHTIITTRPLVMA